MECQNSRSMIPSYLDGELTEAQAGPLRQHLLGCQACRGSAQDLKNVKRWFLRSATAAGPKGFAGPFEDYRRLLLASFPLSAERAQHLETVLAAYARDVEAIQARRRADTMTLYAPELEERGRYYRSLIQDKVLPEDQRERFEQLALGLPTNTH